MEPFLSIRALVDWCGQAGPGGFSRNLKRIIDKHIEQITLLELLEEVNPCGQEYLVYKDIILITYQGQLNLLSFGNDRKLNVRTRIIGMPISISLSGIWAGDEEASVVRQKVLEVLSSLKGLTVVLNSDIDFPEQNRTLSNFVFLNRFNSFEQYVEQMRSAYRRHLIQERIKGKDLSFHKITPSQFSMEHYQLYLSVMKRSNYPLEVLSQEFFRHYPSELFEIKDSAGQLLAFIQMKGIGDTLHFMFCGFKREGKGTSSYGDSAVLYQNMLIFILRYGIEKGYKAINMGQTSEEAKLKLGCLEELKYLHIRHSNSLIDGILRMLSGRFSYKGYPIGHRVFKKDQDLNGRASRIEDFPKKDQGKDTILPA